MLNVFSVIRSAYFRLHKNKRLTTTVTKTLATHSPGRCVNHCLATEGWLAVNFISSFRTICELTSGITNMSHLVDDHSSNLYVVGKCNFKKQYISKNEEYQLSTPLDIAKNILNKILSRKMMSLIIKSADWPPDILKGHQKISWTHLRHTQYQSQP